MLCFYSTSGANRIQETVFTYPQTRTRLREDICKARSKGHSKATFCESLYSSDILCYFSQSPFEDVYVNLSVLGGGKWIWRVGLEGEWVLEDLCPVPWQSPRTSSKPTEKFCSTHGTKAQNYWTSRSHRHLGNEGISSNHNGLKRQDLAFAV